MNIYGIESLSTSFYYDNVFHVHSQDNRPGLVPRHIARIHQQQKKGKAANVKNNQKPKGLLEKEKREEGLGLPLTSDNKGFSLLQKMGFKPGMVLGKSGIKTFLLLNALPLNYDFKQPCKRSLLVG